MGELSNNYFDSATKSNAYFYKTARPGLKDTLGVRRKMVNLFKAAYMDKHENIDLNKWMALKKHGYCFAPRNLVDDESPMAMDVISKDGFVSGVVVGSVPTCENASLDNEFDHKFPPPTKKGSSRGGC